VLMIYALSHPQITLMKVGVLGLVVTFHRFERESAT
jgi:hypothetical protein